MKKIICFAVVSIAFASCQKTQKLNPSTETSSSTVSSSQSTMSARTGGTNSKYRIFSRVRGSYGCSGTGGNCLPDVVVKPHAAERVLFRDLFNVIASGDSQVIRNFFELNSTALSVFIPVEEINYVISGTDTVTSVVNSDGISNYIIFTNEGSTMLVLPVMM